MASQSKTSPWVYFAAGCLALVMLLIAVVVGFVFMAYRWGKGVEETLKDPVTRTERVKELLGCQELPEGYNAMLGLSVPFVAEIAVLSDNEPGADGMIEDFEERGFIYVKMSRLLGRKSKQDMLDFLEGKKKDSDVFIQSNIHVDADEIVKRGRMELDGPSLIYAVHRGNVEVEGREVEGLATMMLIECPEDDRTRLGIWFGRDPSGGQSLEDATLEGSTADESAIRDFLGRFSLCEG